MVATLLTIGLGTLVGWAAGSPKGGLIGGCVLGLPAGIVTVYRRYRGGLA
ncbi:MAG: hypothetical protein ACRDLK_07450 [Gaiellaceae bacterium]